MSQEEESARTPARVDGHSSASDAEKPTFLTTAAVACKATLSEQPLCVNLVEMECFHCWLC